MHLRIIDTYVFVVLGSFSFIICLIVIVFFLCNEYFRKKPGAYIIFGISITDFFSIIHLLSQGIYRLVFGKNVDEIFCHFMSYIGIICLFTNYYYNMVFCLFIFVKIRGSLFNKSLNPIYYNSICIILTTLLVFWIIYGDLGG